MSKHTLTPDRRRIHIETGKQLRRLWKGLRPDLTLAQFAAALDMSVQQLRYWMDGDSGIPDSKKPAIAKILHCHPADILYSLTSTLTLKQLFSSIEEQRKMVIASLDEHQRLMLAESERFASQMQELGSQARGIGSQARDIGHYAADALEQSAQQIEELEKARQQLKAIVPARLGFYSRSAHTPVAVEADAQTKAACGLPADAPNELAWQTWYDRIHTDDHARVNAELTRLNNPRDGVFNMQYRLLGIDGIERCIIDYGRMIFDSAGEPVRLRGLMLDITDEPRSNKTDDKIRHIRTVVHLDRRVAERQAELQAQQDEHERKFNERMERMKARIVAKPVPESVRKTMENGGPMAGLAAMIMMARGFLDGAAIVERWAQEARRQEIADSIRQMAKDVGIGECDDEEDDGNDATR